MFAVRKSITSAEKEKKKRGALNVYRPCRAILSINIHVAYGMESLSDACGTNSEWYNVSRSRWSFREAAQRNDSKHILTGYGMERIKSHLFIDYHPV